MRQHSKRPRNQTCLHTRPPEMLSLIIDSKNEAHFSLPRDVLTSRSAYFNRTLNQTTRKTTSSTICPPPTIRLPKIRLCDFFDFVRWLETGRILQYSHSSIGRAVQDAGSRLVNALELGIALESEQYQAAALHELFTLGRALPEPDELVDHIFGATREVRAHPARKLVVAIVAYRTGGVGRRLPAPREGERQVVRSEGVVTTVEFWKLYDEYCRKRGFRCEYPGSIEEALS